jgi:ATP-dependent DNA helicase RecG
MQPNLRAILTRLRTDRTDGADVEAKRATGGLPESAVSTVCAFANRPGGGTLLLGIDEAAGFAVVDVDAPALARSLADGVRTMLDPPPGLDISTLDMEGKMIVVATVQEVPTAVKPCRVLIGRQQGVWIRAFDGDYRASDVEIQAFYASRTPPKTDRIAVDEATIDDLDTDRVAAFVTSRRRSATGSSRLTSMTDIEVLRATSVMVGDHPSLAGFLALGVAPQRLFPGLHLRAVNRMSGSMSPALRAEDAPRIEGSIPEIMDEAVRWVARSTPTAIIGSEDGAVSDQPRWPLDAVRELIGNALLHRDLTWSLNEPVILTLTPDAIVIRNPGGLYGIRVDELGTRGVTPARNATLVAIASHVQLADSNRAVEMLATGIPTVLAAFARRSYPAPIFVDDAIRFTVVGRSQVVGRSRSRSAKDRVLEVLGDSTMSTAELAARLSRSEQVVRRNLKELVEDGLVTVNGGRGLPTTYHRSKS